MIVRLVPREVTERAWREHDARLARAASDGARPSVVMADEAAALLDKRELVFRGRGYAVPPVPWKLAVEVLSCQTEMRRLAGRKDAEPAEAVALFRRALRLFKRLSRPVNPLRRLLWPVTRNPYRNATPREVGELLGFFSVFLTLDASGSSNPTTAPRGTSPRRSRPSSMPSPRGQTATASPAPGRIS